MKTTPEALRDLLGMGYDPCPLDVEELERVRGKGYERRLLAYSTESTERVHAFLLLPGDLRPAERRPGILAVHQDGSRRPYDIGKSEPAGVAGDPELAYGLELCQRGYVVLCPDRFGFESRSLARSPYADTFSRFRVFGVMESVGRVTELTEDLYKGCVGNRLLLSGRTVLGQELHELQRSVDCLAAQPEVDAIRIGGIGHSAGGIWLAWLMYLDQRIRVGCASCGTWRLCDALRKDWLRPMQGFGPTTPGLVAWGDTDDVLAGIAPRAFFESRGDGEPREAARLTAKARQRYAELGARDRFEYTLYDADHVFRRDMRERAYAWLDRWL